MDFDLLKVLGDNHGQGPGLWREHLNPQMYQTLRTIGQNRVWARGDDARICDADGTEVADFSGGFGVFGVGRSHRVVRQALHDVLDCKLADMMQLDTPLLPGLLAKKLTSLAPELAGYRVYFGNSGAEAVEAALLFARIATGRPGIVYCQRAFHGLTAGARSVNGNQEFRLGPALPGTMIRLGDLEPLKAELCRGRVAAVIVEPVQGHGVYLPPPGWLQAVQALCRQHGTLLICDEVLTGLGRTGQWWGYQHEGIVPDIITVSKTLSGGHVAVGATIARDWIFRKVYSSPSRVLVHDSTFGGNAMAMAAGLATLHVIEDEDLVCNAARAGDALRQALTAMVGEYELLADVRGRGLLIGLEFRRPESLKLRSWWDILQRAQPGLFAMMVVMDLFQRHHILAQVAGDRMEVIKLLPPYTVGDGEIEVFTRAFRSVMDDAHRSARMMWDYGRPLAAHAIAAAAGYRRPGRISSRGPGTSNPPVVAVPPQLSRTQDARIHAR
jgi:ornithine--oxo-acid transaminase